MDKPITIKWNTLNGDQYEGELIEMDNGTGIILLPNGKQVAVRLDDLNG
jgi:hypothetical protein